MIDIQTGVELLYEAASKPRKQQTKSVDWKHDQKVKEQNALREARKRKLDDGREI